MRLSALNLRYLLWRKEVDKGAWTACLAERTGCERCRAEELVQGAHPRPEEADRIAQLFAVSRAELETVNMIEEDDVDVLNENLRRLISSLGQGGPKQIARDLGLGSATVYRWHRGEQRPNSANLRALQNYFGLPADTKLTTEPLFLSPMPVGKAEQKSWMLEKINRLEAKALRELFPALVKLLRDR